MRAWVAAAILTVIGAVQGCSEPPAVRRDDLALADDNNADGAKNKKSASARSDSPEGTSTELGPGTRGTEPAPEPAPPPATCMTDAQCNQVGRICSEAGCVKGCRDDASCGANQVCKAGQCELSNPNVECTTDYECALGAICVATACKPGCHTSADCPTGQSCDAGACKAATTMSPPPPGAATCASDGQCNPGVNGSGKICSAQGTCVDGCHLDNQCPGTKICVTGACR